MIAGKQENSKDETGSYSHYISMGNCEPVGFWRDILTKMPEADINGQHELVATVRAILIHARILVQEMYFSFWFTVLFFRDKQ